MRKLYKLISLTLAALFFSESITFAAGLEGVAAFSSSLKGLTQASALVSYQAPILRFLTVNRDNPNEYFSFLLEKGDSRLTTANLAKEADTLITYFKTGIQLPLESFWVNLNPSQPDAIISSDLEQTAFGAVLLATDLQLKKDVARIMHPKHPQGKLYWDKLFAALGANTAITTDNRVWIVPDKAEVVEVEDGVLIVNATLKVMLENEYLKQEPHNKQQQTAQELMKEIIIPELTKEINAHKSYASLRQAYNGLILAQWFKKHYANTAAVAYTESIHKGVTPDIISKQPSLKKSVWQEYKTSLQKGEYKETASTGNSSINYFSGGVRLLNVQPVVVPWQKASSSPALGDPSQGVFVIMGPDATTASSPAVEFKGFESQENGKSVNVAETPEVNKGFLSRLAQRPLLKKIGVLLLYTSMMMPAGFMVIPGIVKPNVWLAAASLSTFFAFIVSKLNARGLLPSKDAAHINGSSNIVLAIIGKTLLFPFAFLAKQDFYTLPLSYQLLIVPIALAILVTNVNLAWRRIGGGDMGTEKEKLHTDGLYAFSRNPTYLTYRSMAVFFAASALLLQSYLAMLPSLFLWFMTSIQVSVEERHLSSRFGQEYVDYTKRVPRWIGLASFKNVFKKGGLSLQGIAALGSSALEGFRDAMSGQELAMRAEKYNKAFDSASVQSQLEAIHKMEAAFHFAMPRQAWAKVLAGPLDAQNTTEEAKQKIIEVLTQKKLLDVLRAVSLPAQGDGAASSPVTVAKALADFRMRTSGKTITAKEKKNAEEVIAGLENRLNFPTLSDERRQRIRNQLENLREKIRFEVVESAYELSKAPTLQEILSTLSLDFEVVFEKSRDGRWFATSQGRRTSIGWAEYDFLPDAGETVFSIHNHPSPFTLTPSDIDVGVAGGFSITMDEVPEENIVVGPEGALRFCVKNITEGSRKQFKELWGQFSSLLRQQYKTQENYNQFATTVLDLEIGTDLIQKAREIGFEMEFRAWGKGALDILKQVGFASSPVKASNENVALPPGWGTLRHAVPSFFKLLKMQGKLEDILTAVKTYASIDRATGKPDETRSKLLISASIAALPVFYDLANNAGGVSILAAFAARLTDDELLAVITHEIAHVILDHSSARLPSALPPKEALEHPWAREKYEGMVEWYGKERQKQEYEADLEALRIFLSIRYGDSPSEEQINEARAVFDSFLEKCRQAAIDRENPIEGLVRRDGQLPEGWVPIQSHPSNYQRHSFLRDAMQSDARKLPLRFLDQYSASQLETSIHNISDVTIETQTMFVRLPFSFRAAGAVNQFARFLRRAVEVARITRNASRGEWEKDWARERKNTASSPIGVEVAIPDNPSERVLREVGFAEIAPGWFLHERFLISVGTQGVQGIFKNRFAHSAVVAIDIVPSDEFSGLRAEALRVFRTNNRVSISLWRSDGVTRDYSKQGEGAIFSPQELQSQTPVRDRLIKSGFREVSPASGIFEAEVGMPREKIVVVCQNEKINFAGMLSDVIDYSRNPEIIGYPERELQIKAGPVVYVIGPDSLPAVVSIDASIENEISLDAQQAYRAEPNAAGFVIGGVNTDEAIAHLTELTGKSVEQIEKDARPHVLSDAGFLGKDERLIPLLTADNAFVREKGMTHQQLAVPLFFVMNVFSFARWQPRDWIEFQYQGEHLRFRKPFSFGTQNSLFNDDLKTSSDYTVQRLDQNGGVAAEVQFSGLLPYFIWRYGFYEGKGTLYRVDPQAIIDVFFPGRATSSPAGSRGDANALSEAPSEQYLLQEQKLNAIFTGKEIDARFFNDFFREAIASATADRAVPCQVSIFGGMVYNNLDGIKDIDVAVIGNAFTHQEAEKLEGVLNNRLADFGITVKYQYDVRLANISFFDVVSSGGSVKKIGIFSFDTWGELAKNILSYTAQRLASPDPVYVEKAMKSAQFYLEALGVKSKFSTEQLQTLFQNPPRSLASGIIQYHQKDYQTSASSPAEKSGADVSSPVEPIILEAIEYLRALARYPLKRQIILLDSPASLVDVLNIPKSREGVRDYLRDLAATYFLGLGKEMDMKHIGEINRVISRLFQNISLEGLVAGITPGDISATDAVRLVNYVINALANRPGFPQIDLSTQRQDSSESREAEIMAMRGRVRKDYSYYDTGSKDGVLIKYDLGKAIKSAQNILERLENYKAELDPFFRFDTLLFLCEEIQSIPNRDYDFTVWDWEGKGLTEEKMAKLPPGQREAFLALWRRFYAVKVDIKKEVDERWQDDSRYPSFIAYLDSAMPPLSEDVSASSPVKKEIFQTFIEEAVNDKIFFSCDGERRVIQELLGSLTRHFHGEEIKKAVYALIVNWTKDYYSSDAAQILRDERALKVQNPYYEVTPEIAMAFHFLLQGKLPFNHSADSSDGGVQSALRVPQPEVSKVFNQAGSKYDFGATGSVGPDLQRELYDLFGESLERKLRAAEYEEFGIAIEHIEDPEILEKEKKFDFQGSVRIGAGTHVFEIIPQDDERVLVEAFNVAGALVDTQTFAMDGQDIPIGRNTFTIPDDLILSRKHFTISLHKIYGQIYEIVIQRYSKNDTTLLPHIEVMMGSGEEDTASSPLDAPGKGASSSPSVNKEGIFDNNIVLGGRRKGGSLSGEFNNEMWVRAGSYAYKFSVKGDQLFCQRYSADKKQQLFDGGDVKAPESAPLGEPYAVGSHDGGYDHVVAPEKEIFVDHVVKDGALSSINFSLTVEPQRDGAYPFSLTDHHSFNGTRAEWDGKQLSKEGVTRDLNYASSPVEDLTGLERSLIAAMVRIMQVQSPVFYDIHEAVEMLTKGGQGIELSAELINRYVSGKERDTNEFRKRRMYLIDELSRRGYQQLVRQYFGSSPDSAMNMLKMKEIDGVLDDLAEQLQESQDQGALSTQAEDGPITKTLHFDAGLARVLYRYLEGKPPQGDAVIEWGLKRKIIIAVILNNVGLLQKSAVVNSIQLERAVQKIDTFTIAAAENLLQNLPEDATLYSDMLLSLKDEIDAAGHNSSFNVSSAQGASSPLGSDDTIATPAQAVSGESLTIFLDETGIIDGIDALANQYGLRVSFAGGTARRMLMGKNPINDAADVDLMVEMEGIGYVKGEPFVLTPQEKIIIQDFEAALKAQYSQLSVELINFTGEKIEPPYAGMRNRVATVDRLLVRKDARGWVVNDETKGTQRYWKDAVNQRLRLVPSRIQSQDLLDYESVLRFARVMVEFPSMRIDTDSLQEIQDFVNSGAYETGVSVAMEAVLENYMKNPAGSFLLLEPPSLKTLFKLLVHAENLDTALQVLKSIGTPGRNLYTIYSRIVDVEHAVHMVREGKGRNGDLSVFDPVFNERIKENPYAKQLNEQELEQLLLELMKEREYYPGQVPARLRELAIKEYAQWREANKNKFLPERMEACYYFLQKIIKENVLHGASSPAQAAGTEALRQYLEVQKTKNDTWYRGAIRLIAAYLLDDPTPLRQEDIRSMEKVVLERLGEFSIDDALAVKKMAPEYFTDSYVVGLNIHYEGILNTLINIVQKAAEVSPGKTQARGNEILFSLDTEEGKLLLTAWLTRNIDLTEAMNVTPNNGLFLDILTSPGRVLANQKLLPRLVVQSGLDSDEDLQVYLERKIHAFSLESRDLAGALDRVLKRARAGSYPAKELFLQQDARYQRVRDRIVERAAAARVVSSPVAGSDAPAQSRSAPGASTISDAPASPNGPGTAAGGVPALQIGQGVSASPVGGIDLSRVNLKTLDLGKNAPLNPIDRKIYFALEMYKRGWQAVAVIYLKQAIALINKNKEQDYAQKIAFYGLLNELKSCEYLDNQCLEFCERRTLS